MAINPNKASADKIETFVNQYLADFPTLFLVAVELKGNGGRIPKRLNVLLDDDAGITIEACSNLSRALGDWLEENNIIEDAYNLEVGSPGVDYPLNSPRHFLKNVGRDLEVKLSDGRIFKGTLSDADANAFTLQVTTKQKGKKAETSPMILPYNTILTAIVQVKF